MESGTRDRLSLFVEKADEMRLSGLWSLYLKQQKAISFAFSLDKDSEQYIDTSVMGPDEDMLKASLLPLRMFLQKNDNLSLRGLRDLLLREPNALSALAKQEVLSFIAEFDLELEAPVITVEETFPCAVPEAVRPTDGVLTQEEVLKTFLYGHYSHTEPRYRARLEEWRKSPRFAFFKFSFFATVSAVLCTIFNIADALRSELRS